MYYPNRQPILPRLPFADEMKRLPISALFFLALAAWLAAQKTDPTFYAESFRHGSTRVTEESFVMNLTPENPTYRELIKDAHGHDCFVFTVAPQVLEGRNEIVSWQARLVDLHHAMYENILMTSTEPSSDAQNNLWRLDPRQYGAVPTRAKRIIRVDGFYVTLQIRADHFTPLDSPYLDSMTVQVDFKNGDPRAAPPP
jgi:hypothetical protein